MPRSWVSSAVAAAALVTGIIAGPHQALADSASTSSPESSDYGHWRGWAVAGGGAALLMSGIAWQAQASGDYASFDRDFAALCPLGCVVSQLPEELRTRLQRAESRERLSLLGYGLGALTTAAGAYLLYRDAGPTDRLQPRTSRLLFIGGGGLTVALAAVLQWRSSVAFDEYDQEFEARCGLSGCTDGEVPDLDNKLSNARLLRNFSFATYAVGGALIATGAVLAYRDRTQSRHALSIQPNIGARIATLTLQGTF